MAEPIRTVAVCNASVDTVEMLGEILEINGFRTVKAHVDQIKRGEVDFIQFVAKTDPSVIVWDISPPYDENWKFFQLLRSSDALKDRGLVVTTTHKPHLDKMAGQDTGAIEIIGKPYDLELVLRAVRNALPPTP